MSSASATLDRAIHASRPIEASHDGDLVKAIARLLSRLRPARGATQSRHETYIGF
jgi:hypothetical protein